MNRDLTPRERKLLQRIKAHVNSGAGSLRRKVAATDKQLLAWCVDHDLLPHHVQQAREFYYTLALVAKIEACLAQLSLAPLVANLQVSSLAQAALGSAEHKSVRENPRMHRVLCHLGAPTATMAAVGIGDNDVIVDADQRSLAIAHYSALVVVENLDCFYAFSAFQLPLTALATGSGAKALVIYRGDSHYGAGSAALITRWRTEQCGPLAYFGDLDPQGMHIAVSGGFTHIAAPSLGWFSEHASSQAFPAKQQNIAEQLQGGGELSPYIEFCLRYQRAVLQQWLQDTPLQWLKMS